MSARTYRAGTMKEALAQVRRDLGGGAVILGTREVRKRRAFGLGTRELIEVTAADAPITTVSLAAAAGETGGGAGRKGKEGGLQSQFGEQLSQLHEMVECLSRAGRLDHLL